MKLIHAKAYMIERLPVGLELTYTERASLYGRRKETVDDTTQRLGGDAEDSSAYAAEDSQQQRSIDLR